MYADTSKATHHSAVYGVSSQTTNMTSTTAVPIACRDHGTNRSQTSQATLTRTPGANATETMRASRLLARRTTAPTASMPGTVAGACRAPARPSPPHVTTAAATMAPSPEGIRNGT